MKILVGGIDQEANTFSTVKVRYQDFARFKGQALLDQLKQCALFEEAGMELIPAVYASILPSASLSKDEFLNFMDEFFEAVEAHESSDASKLPNPSNACNPCGADEGQCNPNDKTHGIDAVYLCLHGAMHVKDIGSGELYLVQKLRERFGDIPIFASFDFHGTMHQELVQNLNYITAYRTAPHVDVLETGQRCVKALIHALQTKQIPSCRYIELPMGFPGELVITKEYPSCEILSMLEAIEAEGLALDVSWFCGFIWADVEKVFMSLTVTAMDFSPVLEQRMKEAANRIWSLRKEFKFTVCSLKPEEAVAEAKRLAEELRTNSRADIRALENQDASEEPKKSKDPEDLENPNTSNKNLIFVSDSGDNVTAGASGDNAYMTGLFVKQGLEQALIAGLADGPAVEKCYAHQEGERFSLKMGKTLDPTSEDITLEVCLIRKGNLLKRFGGTDLRYALVKAEGVEIILTEQRYDFTELCHFEAIGVDPFAYAIICVKLGYLYPELAEVAGHAILALTKGGANQLVSEIPFTMKHKPFYPKADFEYICTGYSL